MNKTNEKNLLNRSHIKLGIEVGKLVYRDYRTDDQKYPHGTTQSLRLNKNLNWTETVNFHGILNHFIQNHEIE